MSWLVLPLLVLLAGGAIQFAFGPARGWGAFLWRAGLAGFLIAAWGGLFLAQISRFSVIGLSVLLVVGSLALLLLRRRELGASWRALRSQSRAKISAPAALALVVIVAAAGGLAARPGEYFAGGWDPGVYLAAGASIAHRGGLIIRDSVLTSLDERERDALFPTVRTHGIKYPGFYIHDPAAGTVIPQFQPLYPVLLALAISLGGAPAALYVNPALALAGILLLYRLAGALRGRVYGLAAAALLALNVVQVWNSGFATSEMTAQVLLLAGFVFLEDFLDAGDQVAGALAGLAFGLAPLATVTTVLVLPFALGAVLARGGEGRPKPWPFVAASAAAIAHLAIWSLFIAPEYLVSVAAFFPGVRRWSLPVVALAGIAWALRSHARAFAASATRAAPRVLAVGFLCAICWFWVLRPLADPSITARAFVKLSWFLTPWVLVAFAIGGTVRLSRGGKRNETAFVLAGLAMLFFFLQAPRMYPTYPFTLRRFTPLAIPVIAYLAALLPAALIASRRRVCRAGGAALLAAFITVPIWINRDLLRQQDYAGLGSFLAGLETDLPPAGLLLCEGRLPAYALEHFAGRRVLLLDRVEPGRAAGIETFVRHRLAAGEPVTLLTPGERPWCENLGFEPLFSRRLTTTRLEQQLVAYPTSVKRVDLEYTVYRVVLLGQAGGAPDAFPARVDLGKNSLGLGPGFAAEIPLPGGEADQGSARWTTAAAEFIVPWPPGGAPVEVALRVASGKRRREPARLRVFFDGVACGGEVVVPPEMIVVGFGPLTNTAGTPRRRRLRLESSTWNPRTEGIQGYPDGLGVLVDWVEIRPSTLPLEARRNGRE